MRSGRAICARRSHGFAYMLLLVLVAVLGAASAYTVQIGHGVHRRHAEEALLHVGQDFEQALVSFARDGVPGGAGNLRSTGPSELRDLLRDPRLPNMRRHLRRIPADPLTGRADWGLVRDQQGRITGVFSKASGVPIKRTGFGPQHSGFEEAQSYSDWRFGEPTVRVGPSRR